MNKYLGLRTIDEPGFFAVISDSSPDNKSAAAPPTSSFTIASGPKRFCVRFVEF